MKHLKLFEEFEVGDMVYIDTYGPRTYSYSDGDTRIERDMPFRPNLISGFDKDTKYEIIHMSGDTATVFNDENEPVDIPTSTLHYDKMDKDYIMDCIISSFEEMFQKSSVSMREYHDEIIIDIKNASINIREFDEIFQSEFKLRLFDEGYSCARSLYDIRSLFDRQRKLYDEVAGKIQIVVRKMRR